MKKILRLFIVICFSLIIAGCNSKNKEHIVDISLDELINKIESKESFALYIGNEGCTHCLSYKPTLEKVLKDYDITIYHLDNSLLDEQQSGKLKQYINIAGTPTIAFIKNGEEESTLNRITGEVSEEVTIKKFRTNGFIK